MKKLFQNLTVSILFFAAITFPAIAAQAAENEPAGGEAQSYIIGSGDVLEVMTWKEQDLTREVVVRLDGNITFPLLDDIQAAGRTPLQLKEDIQNRLDEFVEAPFVTITVRQSESQKFYILGEVVQTGEYSIAKNLTVLQAFALAGGFTEWASKREILLFREENGTQKTIRINYRDLVNKGDFTSNVRIQANDTIIVP